MAQSVFERKEKKYLADVGQRRRVEAAAQGHLAPDAYGRTLVTSVYLDTPDRAIIARSLEKPPYKEKLRLRAYGECAGEALLLLAREGMAAAEAAYGGELRALPVFRELKKKCEGIVYKRRTPLFPTESFLDQQIGREIEAACARYANLRPSAAIACWRTAWAPVAHEEGPRLTFDDGLSYLDLFADDGIWRPIISADQAVMEVKAGAAFPPWLIEALSCGRLYPRSFSKYGNAARLMKKGA